MSYWELEEEVSPQEIAGNVPQAATNEVYEEEFYDDYEEQHDDSSEESIESLLGLEDGEQLENAMVRLEQGRLYEMLYKHDLFEGVEADPLAIARVRKEIREFIMSRLEVLLGIRAEKEKTNAEPVKVKLPFNEVEIQALKDMAFKLTKGASADADPVETPVERARPKMQRPKKMAPSKPLRSGPARPVQRPQRPPERRQAPKAAPPSKPIDQMSTEELIQRNAQVKKRAVARPTNALPLPDSDSMAAHYTVRVAKNDPNKMESSRALSDAIVKNLGGVAPIVDVGDGHG